MKNPPAWQYDEFKQVGKDYTLPSEVEQYDASHADFRDVEHEANVVLDTLGLGPDTTVIDFGTGTGTFALQAARRCARVYAIDVSEPMIAYAQARADKAGVSNIVFCHGGFLTYEHDAPAVDAISTTFAFHHLPDFWKGVALSRMHAMLKPDGLLHMTDVVLANEHAQENITSFIEQQAAAGGDFLREDAEMHFREEYSTYDWVMQGLFSRAGFTIENQRMDAGVIAHYLSRKHADIPGQ